MTADDDSKIDWSLTTWKGSRLHQHREFLSLPFRRKLEILEELGDHARRFGNVREKGRDQPAATVREDSSSAGHPH